MDTSTSSSQSFELFNLPRAVSLALSAMDFDIPTPIQEKTIPVAFLGGDIVAQAPTGTGKTAAFCLPILVDLMNNPEKSALVLVPTRELAVQIEEFWRKLTRFASNIRCALVIGGVAMYPQIRALSKRPRLIVATPGRLNDHLLRKTMNLDHSTILVLDEADRMLDMGFEPQLKQILTFMPKEKQTLMFSATVPLEIKKIIRNYMNNPTYIAIEESNETSPLITQTVVETTVPLKNETLFQEISLRKDAVVLVFARTRLRTDNLAMFLKKKGLTAERLHGGRTQKQRQMAFSSMKAGRIKILVATDVAARGIDIRNISHVINYDLPQTIEDYIHRIGRTARAGDKGEAISLVSPEDRFQWKRIVKHMKNLKKVAILPKPIV